MSSPPNHPVFLVVPYTIDDNMSPRLVVSCPRHEIAETAYEWMRAEVLDSAIDEEMPYAVYRVVSGADQIGLDGDEIRGHKCRVGDVDNMAMAPAELEEILRDSFDPEGEAAGKVAEYKGCCICGTNIDTAGIYEPVRCATCADGEEAA